MIGSTVNQTKQSYLTPIEFPLTGSGGGSTPTPTAPPNNTPIPTRTPGSTPTPTTFAHSDAHAVAHPGGISLQVYYKVGATGQDTTNIIRPDLEVVNTGSCPHQSQRGHDSLLVYD